MLNVVYMGHNKRGITCLKKLNQSDHNIELAVGQSGENGWYKSIENTAKELEIPFTKKDEPNEKSFVKKLKELSPDLIILCGYSKYIGKRIREIPTHGCINLHAGLLPNYRGAAPLNWALINGEEKIGLSIIFIDDGIDTGPIASQETIKVSKEDTIRDILPKTLDIYPDMLIDVLNKIEKGTLNIKEQDRDEGSYYTNRIPKDGLFDWRYNTDKEIFNLVRALTHPYPGAFFIHPEKGKIYVWEAELESRDYFGISGRVATKRKNGIVVIAKNRGLRINKVQIEGKEETNPKKLFNIGEDLVKNSRGV